MKKSDSDVWEVVGSQASLEEMVTKIVRKEVQAYCEEHLPRIVKEMIS